MVIGTCLCNTYSIHYLYLEPKKKERGQVGLVLKLKLLSPDNCKAILITSTDWQVDLPNCLWSQAWLLCKP